MTLTSDQMYVRKVSETPVNSVNSYYTLSTSVKNQNTSNLYHEKQKTYPATSTSSNGQLREYLSTNLFGKHQKNVTNAITSKQAENYNPLLDDKNTIIRKSIDRTGNVVISNYHTNANLNKDLDSKLKTEIKSYSSSQNEIITKESSPSYQSFQKVLNTNILDSTARSKDYSTIRRVSIDNSIESSSDLNRRS